MSRRTREATEFLNVDLEVTARFDLQPLVDAMGDEVIALFVGRIRRTYHAHFEAAGIVNTADSAIVTLCGIVRNLPRPAARLWKNARTRDFNIGVQAAIKPVFYEIALAPETINAVSDAGGRIVFTVYAPERMVPLRRKQLSKIRSRPSSARPRDRTSR